ncbi:MAG: putative toxin-antitoxin system toxin component, PIN family [Egibacteraceae bacterium]
MIRAVVDPGVFISAFISPGGSAPDQIVRAWAAGAFELLISPKLIGELAEVLTRPKFDRQAGAGRAEAYGTALAAGAIVADHPPDPQAVTRDVDDDCLFALALVGGADLIVSGDRDLMEPRDPKPPVLTPREFADRLADAADA